MSDGSVDQQKIQILSSVKYPPASCGDWEFSTNGYYMLAWTPRFGLPQSEKADTFLTTINTPAIELAVTTLGKLRDWCGDAGVGKRLCETCDNEGTVEREVDSCRTCSGEGTLECDLGHEHECEDCGGTGASDGEELHVACPVCEGKDPLLSGSVGLLGNHKVDLRCVLTVLHPVTDPPDSLIKVSSTAHVVRMDGKDWIALISCNRSDATVSPFNF